MARVEGRLTGIEDSQKRMEVTMNDIVASGKSRGKYNPTLVVSLVMVVGSIATYAESRLGSLLSELTRIGMLSEANRDNIKDLRDRGSPLLDRRITLLEENLKRK